jgi:hypothetical protein
MAGSRRPGLEPPQAPTASPEPNSVQPPDSLLPTSSYLPAALDVHYADCFDVFTEGTYARADVESALLTWGLSQSEIDGFGWQDGAYRVFRCADPPVGRAGHLEVIIHRFRDNLAAQHAEPYFAGRYDLEANEMRACDTAGSLVICVMGRSLTGSPLSDVQFVLQQVVGAAH